MYIEATGSVSLPAWEGNSEKLNYPPKKAWTSDRFRQLMYKRLEKRAFPTVELQFIDLWAYPYYRDDYMLVKDIANDEHFFSLVELYVRLSQFADSPLELRKDMEGGNIFLTRDAHVQVYWIPGSKKMHVDAGKGLFLPSGPIRVFFKP